MSIVCPNEILLGQCEKRESNPCPLLGKQMYYHYTILAKFNRIAFRIGARPLCGLRFQQNGKERVRYTKPHQRVILISLRGVF